MSEVAPDLLAVELVQALGAAGIPCAIGGAIAFGFWGGPRGTKDVDLNAFVDEPEYGRLLDVLAAAGCVFERERCLRQAREGETVVMDKDGVRVDVFVPSIPYYAEAQRGVRRVVLRGVEVPVLGPEPTCVFKLLFFRGKDLEDLKRLVGLQGAALDHGAVRAALVEMVGETDERVEAWDRIVAEHGPPR